MSIVVHKGPQWVDFPDTINNKLDLHHRKICVCFYENDEKTSPSNKLTANLVSARIQL